MRISQAKNYFVKGLINLKEKGVRDTLYEVKRVLKKIEPLSFKEWFSTALYSQKELDAQRQDHFERDILFSIVVPLYNTDKDFLKEMIDSVIDQTYSGWELCLADGSDAQHGYVEEICKEYAQQNQQIKYQKLEKNLGIVGNSNFAMEMATGDFIALLDHDDILHPAALHDVMKAICEKDADFVYTDEMTFISPNVEDVVQVNFKPDFSPDMLRTNNYICHFTSFQRALLDECGGFREGFEGSQDHELFLRLTQRAKQIVHVPEVLYYWRATPNSTAMDAKAKPYCAVSGRKAVRESLHAQNIEAEVRSLDACPTIYHVDYELPKECPKISIVIASCDHADLLDRCISVLKEKTTYPNYELIVVENNSKQTSTFTYYKKMRKKYPDIKLVTWPGEGFNWSAINNYGIREAASGEYVLLLNNDTEVITPNWLEEMMMYGQRPDVGIVGAMLYYPNDTIQHAGVIMGMGGLAAHAFSGIRRGEVGYMARAAIAQNYSAVTGACLLIRRSVFDEVGGIEEQLSVNYNDIDLCLKVRKAGYLIVWTPYAELYHYEQKSRGKPNTKEKKEELEQAREFMIERWRDILIQGDPYFNPNFSLRRSDYQLLDKQGSNKKEYDFTKRNAK